MTESNQVVSIETAQATGRVMENNMPKMPKLMELTGYAGKPQQWQRGFDLAFDVQQQHIRLLTKLLAQMSEKLGIAPENGLYHDVKFWLDSPLVQTEGTIPAAKQIHEDQHENDMLAVENANLKDEIALLKSEQKRQVKQLDIAVFGEDSAHQATLGDLVMRIPDEMARIQRAFLEERRAYRSEIEALKAQLEQIDTVRSGLPCDHIWMAGTPSHQPGKHNAVCSKCGQTGENP